MEKILMSGGQLLKVLTLLEQKGATPESVQRAIASELDERLDGRVAPIRQAARRRRVTRLLMRRRGT